MGVANGHAIRGIRGRGGLKNVGGSGIGGREQSAARAEVRRVLRAGASAKSGELASGATPSGRRWY